MSEKHWLRANEPKPNMSEKYRAFCSQCYTADLSKKPKSKKAASVDATSHMNQYGHNTFILPESTLQKITSQGNPPVKIYDRVLAIEAQKGPGHRCDAGCLRAGHRYRHVFREKASIFGLPDGSLVIR